MDIVTKCNISIFRDNTQKPLNFRKFNGLLCRKLEFLYLLIWNIKFRGRFHLELVHGLAGFGDIDRVAVTIRHVLASPSICCSGTSHDVPSIVVLPTSARLCLPIRGTNTKFFELFTILSFRVHNSDMIVLYCMCQEIQFSSLSFLFLFNTKTGSLMTAGFCTIFRSPAAKQRQAIFFVTSAPARRSRADRCMSPARRASAPSARHSWPVWPRRARR